MKDHPQSIIAQYVEKGLDKFELFLMISLGRHVDEKDNLSSRAITYTQSLQFLEVTNILIFSFRAIKGNFQCFPPK